MVLLMANYFGGLQSCISGAASSSGEEVKDLSSFSLVVVSVVSKDGDRR